MNESTVVLFPNSKRETPPQSLEEIQAHIEQVRQNHVEELCDTMAQDIFELLMEYGVTFNDEYGMLPEYYKDAAMIIESVRSILNRKMELNHFFHDYAEKLFDIKETADGVPYISIKDRPEIILSLIEPEETT